jgi:hypothetical protein
VPDLCKAYTPGKSDQDLPARVNRLEQIIESAFPQLAYPGTPSLDHAMPTRSGSAGGDDSDNSFEDGSAAMTQYHQSARLEDGRWFGDSVSTSIAPIAVLEQVSAILLVPTHRI